MAASTFIKNVGYIATGSPAYLPTRTKSAVLTTSANTAIVVIGDTNQAAADAGYGEENGISKLYVYESNSSRTTWTLRATITPSATLDFRLPYSIALFANNDIAIAYTLQVDSLVKYRKVTYAGWAVSAEESVFGSAQASVAVDVTVTDRDVPVVAAWTAGGVGYSGFRVAVRRTSDSTWQMSGHKATSDTIGGAATGQMYDVSCVAVGGGSATDSPIAVMFTHANSTGTGVPGVAGTDKGHHLFVQSMNETNGAEVNTYKHYEFKDQGGCVVGFTAPLINRRRVMVATEAGPASTAIQTLTTSIQRNDGRNTVIHMGRYTWDNATKTLTTLIDQAELVPSEPYPLYQPAITFSGGASGGWNVSYIYSWYSPLGNVRYMVANFVVNQENNAAFVSGKYFFTNRGDETHELMVLGGSTARSGITGKHDLVVIKQVTNAAHKIYHNYVQLLRSPASPLATPAHGSTVATSLPALALDADIDTENPQSRLRIKWQFATDAGFTTNLKNFLQDRTKFISVQNTHLPGTVVRVNDVLSAINTLPQGVWWMRALQQDEFGNDGVWSTSQSFTVAHPPAAASLTPDGGQSFNYPPGGVYPVQWNFTDTSPNDYQTSYQIIVERVSDGAAVYDSGKTAYLGNVNPQTLTANVVVGGGFLETMLRWKIRLWDRDDVAGAYSSYATFLLLTPPGVVINEPDDLDVLATGRPPIELGLTLGARTLSRYQVMVTQGATVIHDSGVIVAPGGITGTTTLTYTPPTNILQNNQMYTFHAQVWDSFNATGITSVTATTDWIPPAGPSVIVVDTDPYEVETQGYVLVTWDDTSRDAEFKSWRVYRTVDQINPNTGAVLETGEPVLLGEIFATGASYEYKDYYAPAGQKSSYIVKQVVDRFGDEVESENTNWVESWPSSEGYWIVSPNDPDVDVSAIHLSNVVNDGYADEYEEVEFMIAGRGRHVERGQHLGIKGTLSSQLRDTMGGTTARQKKRRLTELKEKNRVLYLRTPFGDVYRVVLNNLAITRISGVGKSEFCNVDVPYTEVGD